MTLTKGQKRERMWRRVMKSTVHTALDGWVLMLLWGLMHLNYGWPTFPIAYMHAWLIVWLFYPVFGTMRIAITDDDDPLEVM